MSGFRANDRVVCIDATPFPLNAGRAYPDEFSFPHGLTEEGCVYCVSAVGRGSDGHAALWLAGYPVIHLGQEIAWNGQRFRKLRSRIRTESQRLEKPVPCIATDRELGDPGP
ncbi:MAG: hypothetical protein ABGZ37_14790 [Akkermansiaceae bacterium]